MHEYPTITVFGNGGIITAGAVTGKVLNYEPSGDDDADYSSITRIDVDEWRRAYPEEDITKGSIDILDIGYWYEVDDAPTLYEPPAEDWRNEVRRGQYVPVFGPSSNGTRQIEKRATVNRRSPLLTILAGIGVGLLFLALAAGFAWLVYGFFYTE